MSKVFIDQGLSCGLNYQSDYIIRMLYQNCEITDNVEEADTIVFPGSCSSTIVHISKCIGYMNYILKQKKVGAKVYLTGCFTRPFVKEDPFLDKTNQWIKKNIDVVIPQNNPNLLLEKVMQTKLIPDEFGMVLNGHRESHLYISQGCLNNCAFCKKTFQHYPLKSMELEEVKALIDQIDKRYPDELTIRGTNVAEYGIDLYKEPKLPEIIEYLETKNGIKNVKLIGFSFKDGIKYNFKEVIKNSTKITELNGSLESGSNRLLSLMRKGFTSEEFIDFASYIRKENSKDLHLNIIAGYPTETLEDVNKTIEVLKIVQPNVVNICKYIDAPFIDSHMQPQLNQNQIDEHAKIYVKELDRIGIDADLIKT